MPRYSLEPCRPSCLSDSGVWWFTGSCSRVLFSSPSDGEPVPPFSMPSPGPKTASPPGGSFCYPSSLRPSGVWYRFCWWATSPWWATWCVGGGMPWRSPWGPDGADLGTRFLFRPGSDHTRSLEGSAAVLVAGTVGGWVALGLLGIPQPLAAGAGLVCGCVAAVAEGLSGHGSDNFWVQVLPALVAAGMVG